MLPLKKPYFGWITTAILASLALVAKFGFSRIPNFQNAIVLFSASPHGGDTRPYLRGSWLGPAIAHSLGVVSDRSLFITYCTLTVLVVVLCTKTVATTGLTLDSKVVLILALPFLPPLFHWVGYDSLTILLLITAYRSRRTRSLCFLVAVLAGMQHAEVTVAASVQALLYDFNRRKEFQIWRGWQVTVTCGALVGRLLLELIFRHFDSSAGSRLGEAVGVFRTNFADWRVACSVAEPWHCFPSTTPILVLSIVWTMTPLLLITRSRVASEFKRLLTAVVAAAVLVIPVLDQTRIAVLSLTFVILMFYETNSRAYIMGFASKSSAAIFGILWLFVPVPWVWEGEISWYGVAGGLRSVLGLI